MDDIAQAFTIARILFWSLIVSSAVAISTLVALVTIEVYHWRRERAERGRDEAAPG